MYDYYKDEEIKLALHKMNVRKNIFQKRKARRRKLLQAILDPIAYLVGVIAIIAISTLDSDSWIPAIALGVSAIYLAIYGAWGGWMR